ncbi:MAG: hypothetical protein ACJAUP_003414 [Cellvibrionaceae bacterium]|jgi:uncharacterized protein with von Willebrand factor type A (vWA) domain
MMLATAQEDREREIARKAERRENAAERREERQANNAAMRNILAEISNPNSHIYKNNRMSDMNLAKNYKSKSNKERYGTSYQEFSKPAEDPLCKSSCRLYFLS